MKQKEEYFSFSKEKRNLWNFVELTKGELTRACEVGMDAEMVGSGRKRQKKQQKQKP